MNEKCTATGCPDLSNINPLTSPLFTPRDYGLSTVLAKLYDEMFCKVGIVERSIIDLLVVNKLSTEVNKYEFIRENSGLFVSHLNNIVYFFKLLRDHLDREDAFSTLAINGNGGSQEYYPRGGKEHLMLGLVSYFLSDYSTDLGSLSPINIGWFLRKKVMGGCILDEGWMRQVTVSVCSAFAMVIRSGEYTTNKRNIVDALKWFKCGILNNPYFIANGFIPEYLK